MKYFSQIDQDRYYIEHVINGKREGRFLDVGAHDGIQTSNTCALEIYLNWTGICVEANPELAGLCKKNRPKSHVVQAAVWSEERDVKFSLPHSGNDFLSRIDGIAHNRDYFPADFRESTMLKMRTQTLSGILGNEPQYFDYFSLDVEGAELEALKGINWETTSFGFIALEFGYRNDFLKDIVDYLYTKNYQLHRINQFDADFVPVVQ